MLAFVDAARRLSRGIRSGNAGLAALGALLVARAIIRATATPRRELVYSTRLRRGQEMKVAFRDQPTR